MAQTMRQTAVDRPRDATNDETAYGRRNFLARVVISLHATLAGTIAIVAGGAILSPGFARRSEEWIAAAAIDSLVEHEPTPIAIRAIREDGHAQAIERRIVYVTRTGANSVRALSSTCTHLGCGVRWHAAAGEFRCPCHGGAFDREGAVRAGPPPAPLASVDTRVEGGRILVRL